MPIKVNFSISGRLVRYVLLFTMLIMASVMTFAVWDRQSLLFPVALWTLFLLDVLWVVWFENLGIKITEKRVTFATAQRIGSIMYDDVEKIELSFLPKSDADAVRFEILAEIRLFNKNTKSSKSKSIEWADLETGKGGIFKFDVTQSNVDEIITRLEGCEKVVVKKYSLNWPYEINGNQV